MEDYTKKDPSTNEVEYTLREDLSMADPMLSISSETEIEPSTICFDIYGDNYLKITPEGFFVEGRKVADDKEIYHAFKKWLNLAQEDLDKQDL